MVAISANTNAAATLIDLAALPAPPPNIGLWTLWILIALLSTMLLCLLWWRRWRQPQRRAMCGLKQVDKFLRQGRIDTRAAAYMISHSFRQGLGITRLDFQQPPAGVGMPAWRRVVVALRQACYAPPRPSRDDVLHLIREARRQLRRAA